MIRYLSSADASRLLGVTPATVRLMVKREELRVSAVTEGGIQLFERADVEKLASQRAVRRMGGVKDGA
jgi:DNA-binding transcriptional MerR regulator